MSAVLTTKGKTMTKDEAIHQFLIAEKRRIENILAKLGYWEVATNADDREEYLGRIRDDLYDAFNKVEAILEIPFD